MRDLHVDEQVRGRENDRPDHDRLGRGGTDIGDHRFQRRQRRRQHLVDRARPFGHIDAERRVADTFGEHRQHHQSGDDEGTIGHVADLGHPAADRRSEDDEIERRGDHRQHQAGPEGAPESGHFESVDRAHAAPVRGHAASPFVPFDS